MPARMRGLREAHAYLLLNDPDCSLTYTALRRLVVTGKIPSVRVGKKYLVNLDILDQYLQGSSTSFDLPKSSGVTRFIPRLA